MTLTDPYRGRGTPYLHSGVDDSAGNPSGAVVPPISVATTFRQSVPGIPVNPNDPHSFGLGYEYSRTGNPTRGAFEVAMAAAEQATYAIAFASGSAATAAVVHLLEAQDRMLCVDDVYGGTQRYFRRIVTPAMGIAVDFCDMSSSLLTTTSSSSNDGDDDDDVGGSEVLTNAFAKNPKLCWIESPTNPTLKITDIAAMSKLTKKANCLLAVDNTFCSPYFQSPLKLGADLVVHSVTK